MSETQQTTDNEEQPLDLDAISGRATDLALALAVQTVQRQVLARDVPALVARVRELEADAALGALVRRMKGHQWALSHYWWPSGKDVWTVDAVVFEAKRYAGGDTPEAALRAALGEDEEES